MIEIPYIGLSGVAGAGKDTVYERLRELGGDRFVRLSVADPLKESVAALFNVPIEEVDRWKRDPVVVEVSRFFNLPGTNEVEGSEVIAGPITMRAFLQRYGTEAHRGVFGEDFWLNEWQSRAERMHFDSGRSLIQAAIKGPSPLTIVNTSVRFENEAQRIVALGGQVWHVEGPQDSGAGGHASEAPLPSSLIAARIDNTVRVRHETVIDNGYDFAYLDDQIATLLHGGTLA